MSERLHPGVYVEEVKPAVLAIEGASTSTAALIGVAERGPVNQATLVTSLAEYQRIFGGFRSDSFLTYSVYNFFGNGGKKCYIVRVVGANSATASLTLCDRENSAQAEPTLRIKAANPGGWGNNLDVAILDSTIDPVNEFKLVVKYNEETVETFDNLSMDKEKENFIENIINSGSQYITVEFVSTAQTSSPGVLVSGELDPATLSVSLPADFNLQLDGDSTVRVVTITGTSPITNVTTLAGAIQAGIRAASTAPADAYANATCRAVPSGNKVRLLISSGSQGVNSSVRVTAGSTHDVSLTLKLLQEGVLVSGELDPATLSVSLPADFNLQLDGDSTVRVVTIDGGTSPITNATTLAGAIQAGIRATSTADAYANATCRAVPSGNKVRLIISSGSQGVNSSVRVTAGSAHDASTLLRLLQEGVLVSGEIDTPLSVSLPADFNLQLDGDSTVRVVTIDGGTSPITNATTLAGAIQAGIRATSTAPADAYANATCRAVPSGSKVCLIIGSGSQGVNSSVLVTAGSLNDVSSTLKLTEAKGANSFPGAQATPGGAQATPGATVYLGTSTSGNEPERSTTSAANRLTVNIDGDGPKTITLQPPLDSGVKIANAITAAVQDPSIIPNDPAYKEAYDNFKAEYTDRYKLIFGNTATGSLTFTIGDTNVSQRLHLNGKTAAVSATRTATVENDHSMSNDSEPARDLASVSAPRSLSITLANPPLTISCELSGDLSSGEKIAAAIQNAVTAKGVAGADPGGIDIDSRAADIRASLSHFTCQYVSNYKLTVGGITHGDPRSSSLRVTPASSNDASDSLKLGASHGGTEQDGSALLRPIASDGGDFHIGDHPTSLLIPEAKEGSDGSTPTDEDYVGDGISTGLNALDKITDVSLIAIPGIGSKQVVSAGFGYCNNRPLLDCFFIADLGGAPPTDTAMFRSDVPFVTTPTDARNYVRALPTKNDYGAIYFPWITAPDPIGKGKNPTRILPPSGYVAGMYARIDSRRGVFKAPAGIETNLSNALDLATKIDDVQQDLLNPLGINVIRSFPASGTVIWGTRTLGADSSYRYIPVRRMAIFLRVSIYNGIQYAVFEPNDDDLWASLRLTIGAFMLTQFRAGAFQGNDPSKAYFVKCDATTTTQADIDNGVVNILVGFAPLKPAEFVVLKLSQIAGQSPT